MIVDRMLIRLVMRNSLMALVALTGLFLLVDLLESVGRLMDKGVGADLIALYYASKLPALFLQLTPAVLLLGVASALAQLGRRQELRALAASGLNPWRLFRPVAFVAVISGGLMMAMAQWAVPPATRHMESLMQGPLGRVDSSWRFFRTHLWFRAGPRRLIQLGPRGSDGTHMRGVTVLDLDDSFALRRRWDIAKVRWDEAKEAWTGFQVQEREFSDAGGERYRAHERLRLDWKVRPQHFADLSGRPDEKSLAELATTAEDLERRGLNPAEYRLAWHWRWAYPVFAFLLLLLSFPRWVAPERRSSLALAFLEAAVVVSLAFGLQVIGRFAVSGGLLEPFWGAWGPCSLLGLLGLAAWLPVLRRELS